MGQKILYGKMFIVKSRAQKDSSVLFYLAECADKGQAVDIIAAGEKIRCPHCNSSKCFSNKVGVSFDFGYDIDQGDIYPGIFSFLRFHIMKCIKTEKFFLHELRWEGRLGRKNRCPWCRSSHVEQAKQGVHPDDVFGMPGGTESLDAMEKKLANPYHCKQCHRTFGAI